MVISFAPALWKAAMRFVPVRFVVVIVGLTTRQVVAPLDVPSIVGVMLHAIKEALPDVGLNVSGAVLLRPMVTPKVLPLVAVKLFAFPSTTAFVTPVVMFPSNATPVAAPSESISRKFVVLFNCPKDVPVLMSEIVVVPEHS